MWQLTGSGTGPYEIQDNAQRVAIINHVTMTDAIRMSMAPELAELLAAAMEEIAPDADPEFYQKLWSTLRRYDYPIP